MSDPKPAKGRGRGRNPSSSVVSRPGAAAAAASAASADVTNGTSRAGATGAAAPPTSAADSLTINTTLTTLPRTAAPAASAAQPAVVPKAAVSSAKTVVSSTSTRSNESDKFTPRPDFGKIGRAIGLRTNAWNVQYTNGQSLYRYDVEIKCEFREAKMADAFAVFWEANRQGKFITEPYGAVYDGGKICYSTKPLVTDTENEFRTSVEVDLPNFQRPIRYSISLKYIGQRVMNFADRDEKNEALSVLEMVYRQFINSPDAKRRPNRFAPYGASAFYVPKPGDSWRLDLEGGKEAWTGYYLASKWATGNVPILNIDISNGIFMKEQSVLSLMCDAFNQRLGRQQYHVAQIEKMNKQNPHYLTKIEYEILNDYVKGLQVKKEGDANHTYKVKGVTDKAADQLTFEWGSKDAKKTITVAEYFEQRYGGLRFPFFPCLIINNGKKRDDMFFPLEKCEIHAPQRMKGKLTEAQTATMIRGVCTDAVERARRIEEMMSLASLATDPYAKQFGFTLLPKMMELAGRVLQPPAIEYAQQCKINPRDGAWTMGNAKFLSSGSITGYGMLSFLNNTYTNEIKAFCLQLMTMCKQLGMDVTAYPEGVVWLQNKTLNDIREGIENCVSQCAAKGFKCDLILVPMPARSTADYGNVKAVAEQEFGIMTQVVLLRNIRQIKPQTLGNIALKINTKMGGINSKLLADRVSDKYLLNKPTLVLGMDVTHSNPTEKRMPSIGAAVGNIDMLPGKFCASVNVQKFRGEPVIYLRKALDERVGAFWNVNKVRPERIIVYRDGVDDGYFYKVMTEECKSITEACKTRVGNDFEPKITFIIVQKRHHTRFFCQNSNDFCGKAKNVPPGTCVDKTATHPNRFDFYLCSHYGIQGTSRPTHYTVLRDDNEFSPDEIQALTFQLCHMYARCTRSVSIPAPTYYAHLACERARHHINVVGSDPKRDLFDDSCSSITETNSSDSSDSTEAKSLNVVDSLITKSYFV